MDDNFVSSRHRRSPQRQHRNCEKKWDTFLCHIDFGFMLGSDPNLHGVILTNMLSCFNKKLHDNQLRINDKIVSESILMKSCEIIIDELKRTYDEFFINLCFYKIPNSQLTDNEKAVACTCFLPIYCFSFCFLYFYFYFYKYFIFFSFCSN